MIKIESMENGNEAAYPTQCPMSAAGKLRGGLTKREHFAGLAMQGLVSKDYSNLPINDNNEICSVIVKTSIQIADELLKQLNDE